MTLKNCLITGGPRGIGRATALLAARAGYCVAIAGLEEHAADAAAVVKQIQEGGGKAVAIHADVSKAGDIVRMFDLAEREHGPLTGLVNAAGVYYHALATEFSFDQLARMMNVNVVGLLVCCGEAAKRMSRERGGAGGSIVNISSQAVLIGGRPGANAYAASKAAVDNFTTGFAREVAGVGIRVNTIRPGVIQTDMTASLRTDPELKRRVEASIPLGRVGQPEEIAEVAVWLLSEKASLVTGAHINAGGGGFHVAASV